MSAEPLFPAGRCRLVHGDALAVVAKLPAGAVDLVYLDPPFFTGREQRGGKGADGSSFADSWEGGLGEYLDWLAALLEGTHRLLRRTGSLVLHLDWHAAHPAKLLLDAIYGPQRFVNEIIWHYGSGGRARRHFPRKHDTLLWYARGARHRFRPEAVGVSRTRCPSCGGEREQWNHLRRHVDDDGRVYRTIRSAGRLYRYYDDEPTLPPDVWLDVSHLQQKDPERVGWPTQKPEALLRRVVEAATGPGDVVADLCCGSGTTLTVAQALDRRWIGADRAEEAVTRAEARLRAGASASAPGFDVERVPESVSPDRGRALALIAGLLTDPRRE